MEKGTDNHLRPDRENQDPEVQQLFQHTTTQNKYCFRFKLFILLLIIICF